MIFIRFQIMPYTISAIQTGTIILWVVFSPPPPATNGSATVFSKHAITSLALPALHAQLKDCSEYEWEMVSATINENIGKIVDDICSHQPDILAATCWLFNHEVLMHIISRAKALLPKTCVILGGPEFLGENETFLRKNPFVDCVFRGEGEIEFPKWLASWNQPEQWKSIIGLCYLDTKNHYQDNGLARVLKFDQLAMFSSL